MNFCAASESVILLAENPQNWMYSNPVNLHFSTAWILRFSSENLPCVLQPQEAVEHNPLPTWVTQNFSNNFNWEKLKPKSFLLHSVNVNIT